MNVKSRSYQVQKQVAPGSRVRLRDDAHSYVTIPAGATGTLQSYSNAGFRGIEASVLLDEVPAGRPERIRELAIGSADVRFYQAMNPNGRLIHGVSAGLLEAI